MKKIFLIMAVLMLATPAFAVTVDVWAEAGDDVNEVEIWYETDGSQPRAFALNIAVDHGNIIDIKDYFEGECDDVNRGYGIFPGSIDIDDGDVEGWGEPVAEDDAPGAEDTGIDTNEIVIEMGSLYTGANTPDPCALLCTIIVSLDCEVVLTENEIRGGVVMENPAEVPTVNLTGLTVTGIPCVVPDVLDELQADANDLIEAAGFVVGNITTECSDTIDANNVISTNPAAGAEPGCGTAVDIVVSTGPCCTTCRGDVDGNAWVTRADYEALRNALKATSPDFFFQCDGSREHACMDWDGNDWVTRADYEALRNALKATSPDFFYECGNEPE